jgi:hypothetical protein
MVGELAEDFSDFVTFVVNGYSIALSALTQDAYLSDLAFNECQLIQHVHRQTIERGVS